MFIISAPIIGQDTAIKKNATKMSSPENSFLNYRLPKKVPLEQAQLQWFFLLSVFQRKLFSKTC